MNNQKPPSLKQSLLIRQRGFSLTLALIATLTLLTFSTTQADTIKLNDGRELHGTILNETDDSISFRHQVGGGILETRSFPKNQIESITFSSPDQDAFDELKTLIPTPDLLTAEDYDSILVDKILPFMESHPNSPHLNQIAEIAETIREELEKVANGELKIDGKWISKEEFERDRYFIEGRMAIAAINRLANQSSITEALRKYDRTMEFYIGSEIEAELIENILPILKRYKGQLNEALRTLPYLIEQREEAMNTLTSTERDRSNEAMKRRIENFNAKLKTEKEAGIRWQSIDSHHEKSIRDALIITDQEIEKLEEIDLAALQSSSQTLRRIHDALLDGNLEQAATLAKNQTTQIKNSPYLGELRERINEEQARVAREQAEAEAAEAAEAEAEAEAATENEPETNNGDNINEQT